MTCAPSVFDIARAAITRGAPGLAAPIVDAIARNIALRIVAPPHDMLTPRAHRITPAERYSIGFISSDATSYGTWAIPGDVYELRPVLGGDGQPCKFSSHWQAKALAGDLLCQALNKAEGRT